MSTAEQEANVRAAIIGGQGAKVYLTRRQRVTEIILACITVAGVVGAVILFGVRATANGTEASLRQLCPLARDIGNSTIPPAPAGTTADTPIPTGIQDIGYMRIFYESSCSQAKFGALKPAQDDRLVRFLQQHGH